MTTYGLLLFDDCEELDFVGPWEVFTASAMVRENREGSRLDQIVAIAEHDRPIRCNKGLRILPDHTLEDHPDLDVLLVPGGMGTRAESENRVLLDWIAKVSGPATWVTSVCTGSYLLHRAGVADGLPLATHWGFEDQLEVDGATVVRDQRWAVSGKVVSSQGVSAGIDMALWLIGQIDSPEHARLTQRYIQYDPAPPYADAE